MSLVTDRVADTSDLISSAAALTPLLEEASPETVELRRPTDRAIEAYESAGITRMTLPAALGGAQASARTCMEVMANLAEGDGAMSWVASVYSASAHIVCAFGDQALQEFLASETPRSSAVFAPTGTFERTDGGYRVSGTWGFNSGQHHAGWAIVPAMPADGAGPPVAFMIPRDHFTKQDDWYVTGFIGTGSNGLAITDEIVPEHRALPFMSVVTGDYRSESLADDPYYHQPFVPVMCALSVGTPIGLARAAVATFKKRIHTRGITYTEYKAQAEAPVAHFQLAAAQMKLDQAEFHAGRLVDCVDAHVTGGMDWTVEERVRCRADVAEALKLSREACEIVEHGSGASAIHSKDPLPRILRDIRVISVHSFLVHSTNAELYGRVLAGQDPGIPFI